MPIVGDFERDLGAPPRRRPTIDRAPRKHDREPRTQTSARAAPCKPRRARWREDDAFLLGIDLVKDVAQAWRRRINDSRGVTETFVRNALTAVNRELGRDVRPAAFRLRSALGSGA